MPRRGQKKSTGLAVILVIGGAGLLVAAGFLVSGGSGRFSGVQPLDVGLYLQRSQGLADNEYRFTGRVVGLVVPAAGGDRLFEIEPESAPDRRIAVSVPAASGLTLQAGQEFSFRVRVGPQGILELLEMEKT